MADPINITDITPEILEKMVGDGRAVLDQVMPGQWSITAEGKVIGAVNTDHLLGEQIVTVGERVIGRISTR